MTIPPINRDSQIQDKPPTRDYEEFERVHLQDPKMREAWEGFNNQLKKMVENPPDRTPYQFLGPGNAPPYQNPLAGFEPVMPTTPTKPSFTITKPPKEKTFIAHTYDFIRELIIIIGTFIITSAISIDRWILKKIEG